MTLSSIRQSLIARLTPSVGDREARAMVGLMLENRCNITPVEIAVNPDKELSDETISDLNRIADRVIAGEPLQYVLGVAPFHGLSIAVTPGVLIPRPETAELVDIIIDDAGNRSDLKVLDVCTGSGCIAVALGRALKYPEIAAVDVEDIAIQTTELNARRLKVDLHTEKRDVLTNGLPDGRFDIIVSNPPYVDESEKPTIEPRVLEHEPSIALFVPDDNPLVFYKAIAEDAFEKLSTGGTLYFEINPRHVDELKTLLAGIGFRDVEARRDFNGQYRFMIARP